MGAANTDVINPLEIEVPAGVPAAKTIDSSAASKATPSSPSKPKNEQNPIIILWDLDETLIAFQSVLQNTYKNRFPVPEAAQSNVAAVRKWREDLVQAAENVADLIVDVASAQCFLDDLKDKVPVSNVNDGDAYDDGADLDKHNFADDALALSDHPSFFKLTQARHSLLQMSHVSPFNRLTDEQRVCAAYRCRRVRDLYVEEAKNPGKGTFRYEEEGQNSANKLDALIGGWAEKARKILADLQDKNARHIIVSAGLLVSTLIKLCMFDLAPYVDVHDVYSASAAGKARVFKQIVSKIRAENENSDATAPFVCAAGDSWEEQNAANEVGITFFKIACLSDLMNIPEKLDECS